MHAATSHHMAPPEDVLYVRLRLTPPFQSSKPGEADPTRSELRSAAASDPCELATPHSTSRRYCMPGSTLSGRRSCGVPWQIVRQHGGLPRRDVGRREQPQTRNAPRAPPRVASSRPGEAEGADDAQQSDDFTCHHGRARALAAGSSLDCNRPVRKAALMCAAGTAACWTLSTASL